MICPFDSRPCSVPRCAVCPVIKARLDEFGHDSGFTEDQIRAGLTTPATKGGEN